MKWEIDRRIDDYQKHVIRSRNLLALQWLLTRYRFGLLCQPRPKFICSEPVWSICSIQFPSISFLLTHTLFDQNCPRNLSYFMSISLGLFAPCRRVEAKEESKWSHRFRLLDKLKLNQKRWNKIKTYGVTAIATER